jgi:hypothetical protein
LSARWQLPRRATDARAWNKLVDAQVAAAKKENTLPQDLGRLGDFLKDKIPSDLGQPFSDLGSKVKEANDALASSTGFDAQKTLGTAVETVAQTLGLVKDKAAEIAAPMLRAADAADRITAATERQQRLEDVSARIAGPAAVLQAARQNEVSAARALVDLRQRSVSLSAQEAGIRLDMLPGQQRMAEIRIRSTRRRSSHCAVAACRARPAGPADAVARQRLVAEWSTVRLRNAASLPDRHRPRAQLAGRGARCAGCSDRRPAGRNGPAKMSHALPNCKRSGSRRP